MSEKPRGDIQPDIIHSNRLADLKETQRFCEVLSYKMTLLINAAKEAQERGVDLDAAIKKFKEVGNLDFREVVDQIINAPDNLDSLRELLLLEGRKPGEIVKIPRRS